MDDRGFSLIEVLLGLTTLSLLIALFVGAFIFSGESGSLYSARIKAVFLAKEGLALARDMRDDSFESITSQEEDMGIFDRTIIVEDIDATTKRVISRVSFTSSSREGTVELETYLTDWN